MRRSSLVDCNSATALLVQSSSVGHIDSLGFRSSAVVGRIVLVYRPSILCEKVAMSHKCQTRNPATGLGFSKKPLS